MSSLPDLELVWPPPEAELDKLAVLWLDETARAAHERARSGSPARTPTQAAAVPLVTVAAAPPPPIPRNAPVATPAPRPHAPSSPAVAPAIHPGLAWPPSAEDLHAITVLERGTSGASLVSASATHAPRHREVRPSMPSGAAASRRSPWPRLRLAAVALCAVAVTAVTARPILDRLRVTAPQPPMTAAAGVQSDNASTPSTPGEAPGSEKSAVIPSPPPDRTGPPPASQAATRQTANPVGAREPDRALAPANEREPVVAREGLVPGVGGAPTTAPTTAPPVQPGPIESAAHGPPPLVGAMPTAVTPEPVAAPPPDIPPTLPARVSIGSAPAPVHSDEGRAPTTASVATPVHTAPAEEDRIRAALGRYRSAYQQLDASAAKAVWPSVDERALARAFQGLRSQEVVFDSCRFSLSGESATATCQGRATYVARVGNSEPRIQARQWTFELRKSGAFWLIRDARVR